MSFHDTKKNNGYHSLFIKLFGHVYGAAFFRTRCSYRYNSQFLYYKLQITVKSTLLQTELQMTDSSG